MCAIFVDAACSIHTAQPLQRIAQSEKEATVERAVCLGFDALCEVFDGTVQIVVKIFKYESVVDEGIAIVTPTEECVVQDDFGVI